MKTCRKCQESKELGEYYRDAKATDGKRNICKLCAKALSRDWQKANVHKVRKRNKLWREANRSKARAASKRWNEQNPEVVTAARKRWYVANKEKSRESGRRYYDANKAKFAEKKMRRRAAKLFATPPWLSEEDIAEMQLIYQTCPEGWHVDHIIPLCSNVVCGLHVPWNLQHLSASENLKKRNNI